MLVYKFRVRIRFPLGMPYINYDYYLEADSIAKALDKFREKVSNKDMVIESIEELKASHIIE